MTVVGAHGTRHDGADDRVEPRAIATGSEDSQAHGTQASTGPGESAN